VTAGLDHVGVVVSDLDRALGFWTGLIGLPVTGRGEAGWPHLSELNGLAGVTLGWCTLAVGAAVLELTSYAGGQAAGPRAGEDEPGRAHVGIVVDGDLDELAGRLRGAGVTLRSDVPVRLAAGSYKGWRALYAVDPDGTSVELFERPGDREAPSAPKTSPITKHDRSCYPGPAEAGMEASDG
jgi:glyoxylase I family protein